MNKKVYLGDSVYASVDGYHIILTTENGGAASNTICLDIDVLDAFFKYVENTKGVKITVVPILPNKD